MAAALGELRVRFAAAAAVGDLLPDAPVADSFPVDSPSAAPVPAWRAVGRRTVVRFEPVPAHLDGRFAPEVLLDDCSASDDFGLADSSLADSAVADLGQDDLARFAVAAPVRRARPAD